MVYDLDVRGMIAEMGIQVETLIQIDLNEGAAQSTRLEMQHLEKKGRGEGATQSTRLWTQRPLFRAPASP